MKDIGMSVKTPWLKIIMWAVLLHIILIAISILEVFFYSILINSGQEHAVYEAHARLTGPYISIIFGIPLFYFTARYLAKNRRGKEKIIGLTLPIIYTLMDAAILLLSKVDWTEHYFIFIISFFVKTLAAYFGAISLRRRQDIEKTKNNY